MFNGIIFNQGILKKIEKRAKGINIFIKSNLKLTNKDIGVSVASDGVCLTLISFKANLMEFYLSNETIQRSKFKKKGIQLIKSNLLKNGNFDIKLILKKIYTFGSRNLLVEGGNNLSKSIIKNKLFNQFYLFKSSKILSKLVDYKDFNCFKDLSHHYKNKKKVNTGLGMDSITLYKK